MFHILLQILPHSKQYIIYRVAHGNSSQIISTTITWYNRVNLAQDSHLIAHENHIKRYRYPSFSYRSCMLPVGLLWWWRLFAANCPKPTSTKGFEAAPMAMGACPKGLGCIIMDICC